MPEKNNKKAKKQMSTPKADEQKSEHLDLLLVKLLPVILTMFSILITVEFLGWAKPVDAILQDTVALYLESKVDSRFNIGTNTAILNEKQWQTYAEDTYIDVLFPLTIINQNSIHPEIINFPSAKLQLFSKGKPKPYEEIFYAPGNWVDTDGEELKFESTAHPFRIDPKSTAFHVYEFFPKIKKELMVKKLYDSLLNGVLDKLILTVDIQAGDKVKSLSCEYSIDTEINPNRREMFYSRLRKPNIPILYLTCDRDPKADKSKNDLIKTRFDWSIF